ncbi:hypothetical protein V7S43_018125 [Phytophthora oleae]|uniref:HTH CENPB-type domain-containing protein n=1 Tax=Phytophthora oleae TaxID=2107226 RepID=A0ABD3EV70_9STRA
MATRRSYPAAFKLSVVLELTQSASPPSVRALAQRHSVTPSMIRKWVSIKTELEAAVNGSGGQRKLGSGRRPNASIDTALLQWVQSQQQIGKGLTDREMQKQARVIAAAQGVTDFQASNGYIYSFKQRNKLVAPSTAAGSNKRRKVGPAGVSVQVSQEATALGNSPVQRDCMFGIDIGLKNVKCALVCATTGNILATSSASIQHDANLQESEQSVANILLTVLKAVQALPISLRGCIRSVGICGVMHGIVWWRSDAIPQAMSELLSGGDPGIATTKSWPWSTYITFLDQRCTPALLAKWRAKIQLANSTATATPFGTEPVEVCSSTSPIASGYGLATFAYVMERQPREIVGFDACGTIQDFVAFVLCEHSTSTQNCMDVTDAFSWGGFDINTKTWNPHTYVDAVHHDFNTIVNLKYSQCASARPSSTHAADGESSRRNYRPDGNSCSSSRPAEWQTSVPRDGRSPVRSHDYNGSDAGACRSQSLAHLRVKRRFSFSISHGFNGGGRDAAEIVSW